ncbi:MAG: ECF-type sigma factor [Phycisphaerales bacterium JB060]
MADGNVAPGGMADGQFWAADDLVSSSVAAVLDDLRAIAASALTEERPGHTLQPTALVHEFYLRLAATEGRGDLRFPSREHLLAYATRAIGHILVDHARRRNAVKRGGGSTRCLSDADSVPGSAGAMAQAQVLTIAELLAELERANPRAARVAQMRYYGQMPDAAIARVLDVSVRTVRGDWQAARAWLAAEMTDGRPPT